jgi:hypothetical protein
MDPAVKGWAILELGRPLDQLAGMAQDPGEGPSQAVILREPIGPPIILKDVPIMPEDVEMGEPSAVLESEK